MYVYLDPRKPGDFNYEINGEIIHFDYEPFYVGKGKDNRAFSHMNEAEKILKNNYDEEIKYNGHKIHIINKIKKTLNCDSIVIKIRENVTDYESCDIEKYLIRIIGRHDLKLGPLSNLTDGGDGGSTTKGMIAVTNGNKDLKVFPDRVPQGFNKGSISKPNLGKTWRWVNDGENEFWDNTDESTEINIGRIQRICITNGEQTKKIKLGNIIPEGWYQGKHYSTTKNTIWINNGKISKMVDTDTFNILEKSGWIKGMLKGNRMREIIHQRNENPDRRKSWNSGKSLKWITNGTVSKQILVDEDIPVNFRKGRK